MAYIGQDKKKAIAANLRKIIPQTWKWSLRVDHYSTLGLTIQSAPVDLIGEWLRITNERRRSHGDAPFERPANVHVNHYYIGEQFDDSREVMGKILDAMNDGNHDRSDSQSDYFDVGWYVSISLGRWDRPFVFTG